MRLVESQIEENQVQLDTFTRLKFALIKWKSAQYFANLIDYNSSLEVDQTINIPIYRKFAFQTFDFLERIQSHVRTKTTGAGYPHSYGTNWITPQQLQLIREMGYVPVC